MVKYISEVLVGYQSVPRWGILVEKLDTSITGESISELSSKQGDLRHPCKAALLTTLRNTPVFIYFKFDSVFEL